MEKDKYKTYVDSYEYPFARNWVVSQFAQKIQEGNYSREEDIQNHFCVYFVACDFKRGLMFIGHHKKSGLWLFNGGHMEKGESYQAAVKREAKEELGVDLEANDLKPSFMLSVTEIDNEPKQKCKKHFDVWFVLPIDSRKIVFDENLLKEEFNEFGWKTISEIDELVTDENTKGAVDQILLLEDF